MFQMLPRKLKFGIGSASQFERRQTPIAHALTIGNLRQSACSVAGEGLDSKSNSFAPIVSDVSDLVEPTSLSHYEFWHSSFLAKFEFLPAGPHSPRYTYWRSIALAFLGGQHSVFVGRSGG
jgi:hypothetical protein